MQALHIPETNKPLCVKLSYGSDSQTTFSVPHTSDISWYYDYNDNGISPNATSAQANGGANNDAAGAIRNEYMDARNSSLAKTFEVDCFNSRGLLRIRVLADYMTKRVEIARIRVPLFNILDCVCQLSEEDTYTRWFPLVLTKDSIATEGEIEMFGHSNFSEQNEPFEYQPCIRLMFRWLPEVANKINTDETAKPTNYQAHIQELTKNQKLYIRASLPSVSISVIDSDYAREIIQVCASRIEFRKYANLDYTDYIFYTDTFQIDNQLADSITPVLLHQTQAKFQQPIIRLLLRKNNRLSNLTPNLTCYDNFQLVIQELDLHLEQQTVVASWELSQRVSPMLVNIFPPLKDSSRNSVNRDGPLGSEKNLFGSSSVIEDSLYIERFSLNGIKINVSFLMTPEVVESHRKRSQSRESQVQYGAVVLTASSSFLRQVGEVVLDLTSNITNTPIFLSGMEKEHLSMSGRELTAKLQDIYFQSLVREVSSFTYI